MSFSGLKRLGEIDTFVIFLYPERIDASNSLSYKHMLEILCFYNL